MFHLTTHSTHFIYGYMASDIWLRTILIVRMETRCRHIGYPYQLTARVLYMHHPTDRITHTTAFVTPVVEHWLEREIAQWVHPMKDWSDDPSHHERTLYLWATSRSLCVLIHKKSPGMEINYDEKQKSKFLSILTSPNDTFCDHTGFHIITLPPHHLSHHMALHQTTMTLYNVSNSTNYFSYWQIS